MYYMNIIIDLIHEIGKYGPIILIITSFYLLWNKPNLYFYYVVGVFINSILNIILKGIFLQPRPNEDIKDFNLALKNGRLFIFKNGIIPLDIFGMPSGHSQSAFFSCAFIYLALRQLNILWFYLSISFITIYQRVSYKYHSVLQVLVGGVIGVIFAYLVYYLSQQKIKGIIREKQDDNGPY